MGYKVVMHWDDGDEELDDIVETEAEADAYALTTISDYHAGGEVLHLSNPGDYPSEDEDEDPSYDIIEVDE